MPVELKTRPIHVAVIGAGRWGGNLIRNVRACRRLKPAVVCDTDPQRLSTFDGVETATESAAVFDDQRIDAVVIATPPDSHHRLTRAALAAGKHVLCEKPLAMTVGECIDLACLAEQDDLCLMVDCTPVYLAGIRSAKQNIPWEKVRRISCLRTSDGPSNHNVNVLWDLACHDLAVLHDWLGRLPEMQEARPAVKNGVTLRGEIDGGPSVEISVGYESKSRRAITVSGELKTRTFRQRQTRPEPLRSVVSHFADCIRNNTQPLTGAACAIATARSINAVAAHVAPRP